MTEILPSIMYGDPADTIEFQRTQERHKKRETLGCLGCKHKVKLWDIWGCGKGNEPHKGGWCNAWHE